MFVRSITVLKVRTVCRDELIILLEKIYNLPKLKHVCIFLTKYHSHYEESYFTWVKLVNIDVVRIVIENFLKNLNGNLAMGCIDIKEKSIILSDTSCQYNDDRNTKNIGDNNPQLNINLQPQDFKVEFRRISSHKGLGVSILLNNYVKSRFSKFIPMIEAHREKLFVNFQGVNLSCEDN
jgi:hypothetical protein